MHPPPLLSLSYTCCWYGCWQPALRVARSHVKGEGRMKARLAAFPVTIAEKQSKTKPCTLDQVLPDLSPTNQHETAQRRSQSCDSTAPPYLTLREFLGAGDATEAAHLWWFWEWMHLVKVNWAFSSYVKPICQCKSATSVWGPAVGALMDTGKRPHTHKSHQQPLCRPENVRKKKNKKKKPGGAAFFSWRRSLLLRSHFTNEFNTMKNGVYVAVLVIWDQSGSPACQEN